MDLAVFSFATLLVAGVFAALRMTWLAAGRGRRWAGWAATIVCSYVLVVFALHELRRARVLMSFRLMGSEPYQLADSLASVAAFHDLRFGGPVLFATLGVLQGAALGLALSVITGADAPAVNAASRFEAMRSALGKAIVMLPLPAVVAVLLAFYQDNHERFSSVEVGSFLRLALNPAPVSSSPQSTQQGGPSGEGRQFPTGTFVDRALESLNGALRRRDVAFVGALKSLGTEGRVPTEVDFQGTAFLERKYCGLLRHLPSYIEHFDDYNLLTLDIGEPLISLQVGWELEMRELKGWLDKIRTQGLAVSGPGIALDGASYFVDADNAFARLDRKARKALERIGEPESSDTSLNARCGQPAETEPALPASEDARKRAPATGSETPHPSPSDSADKSDRDPNRQNEERTRNRIIDLHAPYRAIGIANFYAAIGSFETAYLVLQRWLVVDSLLRAKDIKLHDALPRWFRLRVMSEAARMYKNTSPEARLSERYRRHLTEILQEYRDLLSNVPTGRKVGASKCFAPSAAGGPPAPGRAAPDDIKVDPLAALMLGRVTSEIEFFEVSGLTGAISQRHVEEAKTLTLFDFRCFEDAFEPTAQLEDVRTTLQLYQANAVVAWGRLAIRWAEAGRALRRVSDSERKAMLAEVRVAVGGAVERLEHHARVEEGRREAQRGFSPGKGVEAESTLDYARVARRVLQEAMALDQ